MKLMALNGLTKTWFIENIPKKKKLLPKQREFARLNISYTIMDKYKNIYDDKIFNLHHSKLTVKPEVEIEKLSKFIGFNTKPMKKIDEKRTQTILNIALQYKS